MRRIWIDKESEARPVYEHRRDLLNQCFDAARCEVNIERQTRLLIEIEYWKAELDEGEESGMPGMVRSASHHLRQFLEREKRR